MFLKFLFKGCFPEEGPCAQSCFIIHTFLHVSYPVVGLKNVIEVIPMPGDHRRLHLLHKAICCQLFIEYSVVSTGFYCSQT